MKIKTTMNMTEKEYLDLCAFLEWVVKHPNICDHCPHFAEWEKLACCGCPEQGEYVKTYKNMPGYEISKIDGLEKFCEAYRTHVKASMRFKALQNEFEEARKELYDAKEKLDAINEGIVIEEGK